MSEDIGMQRARIAPLLTGEDLAELLALADFTISAGGSVQFLRASALEQRLSRLGLTERVRLPDYSCPVLRLTKLGWLTLLTRAETEMRHLLPKEDEEAA